MDHPTLEIDAVVLSDAKAETSTRITIGARSRVDAVEVYLARVAGIDATFAVPALAVRAILDAL